MTEGMAALLIWEACAVLFAGIGRYCFLAKKSVGFFANAKPPEIRDVRAYNRAVGRLWLVFAVVFALLGIPLLWPDSPLVLLGIIGLMWAIIVVIVVYLRIEQKYKK